jgi:putative acetyltransferase
MATIEQIKIRNIKEEDNAELAKLIRSTLAEFGANKPGTVYFDRSTDYLSDIFKQEGSTYFVAELDGRLVGGGGIFPSAGLPDGTCELVKMYLYPEVRGIGLGKLLINNCLGYARQQGYKNVYIETMPELKQALKTYEKFGFEYIDKALGNTGHFGCDLFMLKQLSDYNTSAS